MIMVIEVTSFLSDPSACSPQRVFHLVVGRREIEQEHRFIVVGTRDHLVVARMEDQSHLQLLPMVGLQQPILGTDSALLEILSRQPKQPSPT